MMDAVRQCISALIGAAFLSAISELVLTGKTQQQVHRLITAVTMLTILFALFVPQNWDAYADSIRREHIISVWDYDAQAEKERKMSRLIIEEECAAYILDKGADLQIPIQEAHVTLRWNTEGYWVPDRVQIVVSQACDQETLADIIASDLGVSREKQDWSTINEH